MKFARPLAVLAVLALLFTGCFKVDGEIVINDDGSGEIDFVTAVNPDAISSLMSDFGGDEGLVIPEDQLSPEAICADFADDNAQDDADLPEGAVVSEFDEDGFCGSRLQLDLPASTNHTETASDLFDEATQLFKEGDNWFFETAVETDEITADTDEFGDEIAQLFFSQAEFTVTVDLPGQAVEGAHNADVVEGGRFTWNLDIFDPPDRLFAQTEPGPASEPNAGAEAGSEAEPGLDGEAGSEADQELEAEPDTGGGLGGLLRILLLLALLSALGVGIWWFLKNRSTGSTGSGVDGAQPLAGNPVAGGPAANAHPTPTNHIGPGTSVTAGPDGVQITPTTPATSFPGADTVKDTVMMNPGDLHGQVSNPAVADNPAAVAANDLTAAAAAPSNEPIYDEQLGAWVIDHPTRGRLSHDPSTDTWNPIA